MRVIYKYHLNLEGYDTITGRFVQFLDAQIQDGNLVIWAIVDTEFPELNVEVISTYTGGATKDNWKYFRTIQHDGLVYHVFFTQKDYHLSDSFEVPRTHAPILDLFFGGRS